VVDKWNCGRFSPSTLVSPANSHFTDCSTFVNHSIINATVSITRESFNNKLLPEVSHGFPQFFKENAEIVPQISPQLLHAISIQKTTSEKSK
jgi:hypothetical protein